MEPLPETRHRVSSAERDLAINRLQEAYIRGQLNDHDLGERIDRALAAVVKVDLDDLVSDLPALPAAAEAAPVATVRGSWLRRRTDGKGTLSKARKGYDIYKSKVLKNGAWTVPALFRSRAYKGILILDLRQAVLSAERTVIELDAYKSRVAVIVPPEYNIELDVDAYKGSAENFSTGGLPGAPRLLIRGSAYKGSVVVDNRDPEAR